MGHFVYYNPELNEWHVATRGVPMADRNIDGWSDLTFRKLFEKALADTLFAAGMTEKDVNPSIVFNVWANNLAKCNTYCFELTTPQNRIVVHYPDYRIHLLGIRNTASGVQGGVQWLGKTFFGVPICPSHKLSNLRELLDFVNSKNPFQQEGIVVCDKNFNRVKVKSLAYMAYNRIRDSAANSPRAIMELMLLEKLDDAFPVLENHIQKKALELQEDFRSLISKVDQDYRDIIAQLDQRSENMVNPRKEFALLVQAKKAWMAPLIDRFVGKSKGLVDWINQRKDPATDKWSASFLDTLVEMSEKTKP